MGVNLVDKPEKLKLLKFISDLKLCAEAKQRFCFILGAGASRSAGIHTGEKMAKDWLKHLNGQEKDDTAQWLKENNIDENDLGSHYSKIYERRFRTHPRAGYIWLQNEIKSAAPSLGHFHLAQILADEKTFMNLAITTNFDSLIEDAIVMYTDQKPLIVSHEVLTPFMEDWADRRPIVAKIHRDLMLRPKSAEAETDTIDPQWGAALRKVLSTCSPIVIGYGGNDGSLMDVMERAVQTNEENGIVLPIYWCYIKGFRPKERIQALVAKSQGFLVEIDDFDTAMYLFGEEFGHQFDGEALKKNTEKRIEAHIDTYKKNEAEVKRKLEEGQKSGGLTENEELVLSSITASQRKELESLNAQIEKSPDEPELYHRRGYIYHLADEYQKAIDDRTKAIELDPSNAFYYFMRGTSHNWLNQFDKAVADHTKAIKLDPCYALYYNARGRNYNHLNEYDKAITDFTKAIELEPNDACFYEDLGAVLCGTGEIEKALECIEKGLQIDSNEASLYSARGYANLKKAKRSEITCSPSVLEDFNKGIDSTTLGYNRRAAYYLYCDEYENAYADLQSALNISNTHGTTWYLLAQYYITQGNMEEYERCIRKSEEYRFIPTEDDVFVEMP